MDNFETEYEPLCTEDGILTTPQQEPRWKEYPGNRRDEIIQNDNPPRGTVLVKTGGNALQAVDVDVLNRDIFVSVVVPEGKLPGDTLLVACPYRQGRVISTTIPKGAEPGSCFLVQVPPVIPHVVTGVPVDPDNEEGQFVNERAILSAAMKNELALREEGRDKIVDCQSIDRPSIIAEGQHQPSGPTGKGWIAAMFMGKLMLR